MSTTAAILALVTVMGMATGQVLFKFSAGAGSIDQIVISPYFWAAVLSLAAVTVSWVLLLKEMDLAHAYPLVAATYVLVPLASAMIFGERLTLIYGAGVALIVIGIVLTRLG